MLYDDPSSALSLTPTQMIQRVFNICQSSMIENSFIILPRISYATEMKLWRMGITTWEDFINSSKVSGFSKIRKEKCDKILSLAFRFIDAGNSSYFKAMLPSSEQWRIYSRFRDRATYLDIEIDGEGPSKKITLIGIHRNGQTHSLIRGINLTRNIVREILKDSTILVTFNGSSCDIPLLEKEFPFIASRIPHFDLHYACRRIGITGGLKKVEQAVGIKRERNLEYLTSEHASYLWKLWEKKGNKNALKLLVSYNREDTQSLITLATYLYEQLKRELLNIITESQKMGDRRIASGTKS